MNEFELPSTCPFCKKEHSINTLRIQIQSVAHCPICKHDYFIPYSEVNAMLKFQRDLESLLEKNLYCGGKSAD